MEAEWPPPRGGAGPGKGKLRRVKRGRKKGSAGGHSSGKHLGGKVGRKGRGKNARILEQRGSKGGVMRDAGRKEENTNISETVENFVRREEVWEELEE